MTPQYQSEADQLANQKAHAAFLENKRLNQVRRCDRGLPYDQKMMVQQLRAESYLSDGRLKQ
jgi:hypothetical protein